MVLRDIETGEIIFLPYVHIQTDQRAVYMNLRNFNDRSRAFKDDGRDIYYTIGCSLEFFDCKGELKTQGTASIPKEFFPKAYDYLTMVN